MSDRQSLTNLAENSEYQDIIKRLQVLFKTEEKIDAWLRSTNARTSKPPITYINEGRFDVVSRIVGAIEHGIPS
jgi:Protein of unknown function (DUF2384)